LHVRHAAVGCEAVGRALARSPPLIVEGEHDISGRVECARGVGKVKVLHTGIAMAQDDGCALKARGCRRREKKIAGQLAAFAIKADGVLHITSSRAALPRRQRRRAHLPPWSGCLWPPTTYLMSSILGTHFPSCTGIASSWSSSGESLRAATPEALSLPPPTRDPTRSCADLSLTRTSQPGTGWGGPPARCQGPGWCA